MMWFARTAQKRGFKPRIVCADHDPRAVAFGRAATRGYPGIRVVRAGLDELSAIGPFDYAFSNHLLHHLSDAEAVRTLETVRRITRRIYLMNDIHRGAGAYYGFSLLAGVLFPRSMAYEDGRLSVRRSFRVRELERLIRRMSDGQELAPGVYRLFPARLCAMGRGTAPARVQERL